MLLIRKQLTDRARDFNIILDDVAITELSFGKDYSAAVESKQVAQQEAQRAAFIVDKAIQERQQKIVQAEGEAAAAAMLGESLGKNPGYLKLRKLTASKHISKTVRIIFCRYIPTILFQLLFVLYFIKWIFYQIGKDILVDCNIYFKVNV